MSVDSYKPIYIQISDYLTEEITSGQLKPGDKTPSESELMSIFDVSRNTAQKAIEQLVHSDLVVRKKGKGTFVKSQKVIYKMQKMTSFSEEMQNRGLEASSRIVHIGLTEVDDNISKNLQLGEHEKVYLIERIRYGGKIPMAYQISYVPQKKCPGIDKYITEDSSLFFILENVFSLKLFRQDQTIKPVVANAKLGKLLNVKINTPLLFLQGVAYLSGDFPIEYKKIYYNGETYEFSLHSLR